MKKQDSYQVHAKYVLEKERYVKLWCAFTERVCTNAEYMLCIIPLVLLDLFQLIKKGVFSFT